MVKNKSNEILTDSEMDELFQDSDFEVEEKLKGKKRRFLGDKIFFFFMILAAIVLAVVYILFEFL